MVSRVHDFGRLNVPTEISFFGKLPEKGEGYAHTQIALRRPHRADPV